MKVLFPSTLRERKAQRVPRTLRNLPSYRAFSLSHHPGHTSDSCGGEAVCVSRESERSALWFQFTWGSATQFCFHFGLLCEFPPFTSWVAGVLAKLCGHSLEIVQSTPTAVTVMVHGKNQGSGMQLVSDHFLGIQREAGQGPVFWENRRDLVSVSQA